MKKEKLKNLFSIDLTNDSKNRVIDGEIFVSRSISGALLDKMRLMEDQEKSFCKEATLPLPLRGLRWLCATYVLIILFSFVNVVFIKGIPLERALNNGGYLYVIAVAALGIWLILARIAQNRRRAVETKATELDFDAVYEESLEEARKKLSLPEESCFVDVLCRDYKMKNGKATRANILYDYVNRGYSFFREGENLCFADREKVVSIPISEIHDVEKVKKSVSISDWNKEESYRDSEYRGFGIRESNGFLLIKAFYSLKVGQDYEILVPNYDFAAVAELAGLKMD